jgi:hypothetical protein
VTATLGIQGTTVLTKKARFDLPGVIAVKPGIRLLPAEDYLADDGTNAPTLPTRTLPQQPGAATAGPTPLPRWWS